MSSVRDNFNLDAKKCQQTGTAYGKIFSIDLNLNDSKRLPMLAFPLPAVPAHQEGSCLWFNPEFGYHTCFGTSSSQYVVYKKGGA